MTLARLAGVLVVMALGCGGAPRSPVVASHQPEAAPGVAAAAVEAAWVVELGRQYLAAHLSWRAAYAPLASTDYDKTWDDLDGDQRQQYLEAARQIVELGETLAAQRAVDAARASSLRVEAAAITSYLDGEAADPPGELGRVVGTLLIHCNGVINALARAATAPADGACAAARLELALEIPHHRDAIEDARITAELAVHETGLPPGSAEQDEVEADHAREMAELDAWELGLATGAYADAATLDLAPLSPRLVKPASVVPAPLDEAWRDLRATIAAAQTACAR